MPNYSDLQCKVEEAMAAVVTALAISSFTVVKGLDVLELALPCAVCYCEEIGEENFRDTGIFPASCVVEIITSADPLSGVPGSGNTMLTSHRAYVAQIHDAFLDDAIAATLSGHVSEFYVYDVDFNGMQQQVTDRKFVTALRMSIVCCASDIT